MGAHYEYARDNLKIICINTISIIAILFFLVLFPAFAVSVYAIELVEEEEVPSSVAKEEIKVYQEKADVVKTKKDYVKEPVAGTVMSETQEIKKDEIPPISEKTGPKDEDEKVSSTEKPEDDILKDKVKEESEPTKSSSTAPDHVVQEKVETKGPGDSGAVEQHKKETEKDESDGGTIIGKLLFFSILSIFILIRYKRKVKKYGCPNCRDALMKFAEHRRRDIGYLHPRADGRRDLRYSDNPICFRKIELYRCPKCNHESSFYDGKIHYDYS